MRATTSSGPSRPWRASTGSCDLQSPGPGPRQTFLSVDGAWGWCFRRARTFVQPFMETVLMICGSNLSPYGALDLEATKRGKKALERKYGPRLGVLSLSAVSGKDFYCFSRDGTHVLTA